MVETLIKVGEKGQILIPKLLRDHFGIFPGHNALLKETREGLLLRKVDNDPLEIFAKTAQTVRKKAKEIESVIEQYQERIKKAGIRI